MCTSCITHAARIFSWSLPLRFHREVLASKLYSPEEPQSVFIAGQLFSILESMDFSDEVGRFVIHM